MLAGVIIAPRELNQEMDGRDREGGKGGGCLVEVDAGASCFPLREGESVLLIEQ